MVQESQFLIRPQSFETCRKQKSDNREEVNSRRVDQYFMESVPKAYDGGKKRNASTSYRTRSSEREDVYEVETSSTNQHDKEKASIATHETRVRL